MLIDKVKNTIKKYNLIEKNDKLVIGVSGGPDSVALLYLLKDLKREFKLSLHIAHVDHMLRKGSFKDSEFVRKLSEKLKIPAAFARINVKQLAVKGSLEEIARNARLGFLFNVAGRIKADKIVLGHNLDDQAETVLMRFIRGAGLYGLSGILPKRQIYGYCIIRPLIEVRRMEIEAFLKRRKIKARVDKTNLQDVYFRNKIRNKLMPLLQKEYNRNIKEVLSNTALSVGYDYDYLNRSALKKVERLGARIKLAEFFKLHPSMQRLLLRLHIAAVQGDMRRITYAHINEINDLAFNRPVNSVVDLPKGIAVIKKQKTLFFYRRK